MIYKAWNSASHCPEKKKVLIVASITRARDPAPSIFVLVRVGHQRCALYLGGIQGPYEWIELAAFNESTFFSKQPTLNQLQACPNSTILLPEGDPCISRSGEPISLPMGEAPLKNLGTIPSLGSDHPNTRLSLETEGASSVEKGFEGVSSILMEPSRTLFLQESISLEEESEPSR